MTHFGSFRPADMERLFGRALTGLQSELTALQRRRFRQEPSAAESAADGEAEEKLVQLLLAFVWMEMEGRGDRDGGRDDSGGVGGWGVDRVVVDDVSAGDWCLGSGGWVGWRLHEWITRIFLPKATALAGCGQRERDQSGQSKAYKIDTHNNSAFQKSGLVNHTAWNKKGSV